ncbi:MAG: Uma2 family endonuclease [Planctomycetota bacterium]
MGRAEIRFTREDYGQLPEHLDAELIEGDLVMIPAPTPWHERLAAALMFEVMRHVGAEAPNRVQGSRTEISIGEGAKESIVQPDVVVFPGGTRPTGPGWSIPTPVWVAEVLSPATARRDRGVKLRLYARKGISETWLVDPEAETIEVHDLGAGPHVTHGRGAWAASAVLPGFRVEVDRFFSV